MNEVFGYDKETAVEDELPPIGPSQRISLLSATATENPEKDIGQIIENAEDESSCPRNSEFGVNRPENTRQNV